jgi:hypothetical protein
MGKMRNNLNNQQGINGMVLAHMEQECTVENPSVSE